MGDGVGWEVLPPRTNSADGSWGYRRPAEPRTAAWMSRKVCRSGHHLAAVFPRRGACGGVGLLLNRQQHVEGSREGAARLLEWPGRRRGMKGSRRGRIVQMLEDGKQEVEILTALDVSSRPARSRRRMRLRCGARSGTWG